MRRARLLGVGLTAAALLVLLGSMLAGLGVGEEWSPLGEEPPGAAEERVRVEVLNAAGEAGLARAATERLRDRGFDVVSYGNAEEFGRDTSVVIDRVGREADAERVAEALRIPGTRSTPDSTLFVDVTVLLGRDWARALHGEEEADSARAEPAG